jgi:hypothetical protein
MLLLWPTVMARELNASADERPIEAVAHLVLDTPVGLLPIVSIIAVEPAKHETPASQVILDDAVGQ